MAKKMRYRSRARVVQGSQQQQPADPPSRGGPLTVSGHTPGCPGIQKGTPALDCECGGKEATG